MPWFLCFQSFSISYWEVGLSLSWEVLCLVWKDYYIGQFFGLSLSWTVLCLLWKDYYVDWFPSAARRRGIHIANDVPGPRPRTGLEVETLSIVHCFGGMLSVQIKQQTSMSGVWYFRASALEMEEEEGWFVLRHVKIEAFYPSRFLCSWPWFSTSASITENFLQSWLPCEAD